MSPSQAYTRLTSTKRIAKVAGSLVRAVSHGDEAAEVKLLSHFVKDCANQTSYCANRFLDLSFLDHKVLSCVRKNWLPKPRGGVPTVRHPHGRVAIIRGRVSGGPVRGFRHVVKGLMMAAIHGYEPLPV